LNINDAFPSKFIKSDDLGGARVTLKVMNVTMEDVGGDGKEFKPVMRFFNKEKGMVLNKTNAAACTAIWGPETDSWAGQALELYAQPVMFQGRQVMGLAVAPLIQQQQAQGQEWGTPDHAPHNQQAAQTPQYGPEHAMHNPPSPAAKTLEKLADDIAGAEQAQQTTIDDIPF
jgi:hypothetical protein